ncbi:MAG: DEAD/DEAH box helicase [Candidatus Andersenbacteria bacterium]
MSIKQLNPSCQVFLTTIRPLLEAYEHDIQNQWQTTGLAKIQATPTQLALLAAHFGTFDGAKRRTPLSIVVNGGLEESQTLVTALTAWSTLFPRTASWHLITHELTDQEQAGSIVTNLSHALHYFLAAQPGHHFVIPQKSLALALPDPTLYRQQTRLLQVDEQVKLRDLVQDLVQLGFSRYETVSEPGAVRIRGEHIDISHPSWSGAYTITFYGNTIESIVRHQGRRSETVSSISLPPMKFPAATSPLSQTLRQTILWRPLHLEEYQGLKTVAYDVLQPALPFPLPELSPLPATLSGTPLIIAYKNLARIKQYLADHDATDITLCPSSLAEIPLRLHAGSHYILSEQALFANTRARAPRLSLSAGLALLADLKEGQPAVHADHGIGVYEGLQTRIINNTARDYLMLRYAAGDTLSVPVEYAQKVTAYLGASIPIIHRLGSPLWAATRRQAQHDAEKFAGELLQVARARAQQSGRISRVSARLEEALEQTFPFTLTPDQEETWQAVQSDLERAQPMDRLVVGDVGFGKTEIAIRAAYHVAANGRQVAFLAPTTLLVQQHADSFANRFPNFPSKVGEGTVSPPTLRTGIGVLSRFSSPRERQRIRARIAAGELAIVIGTQALLSKSTHWHNLGLVIIDEEQRFGVSHKEHFKKLRATVDVLSLSATPIPRTLSMALSGLKDLSIISTPPEGRKSVQSYVGPQTDTLIQQALERELARGGQAYVVSRTIRGLSALAHRLQKIVPRARLGVIHGQLPGAKLAEIMEQFDRGKIDILVSSTIIENGLDLPNANTLLVMQATYFGLSELYQLRGRIGRRERQGYAYFLYNQRELTSLQRQRLTALTEATRLGSGWAVAERDLQIRGAGNLLGAEQSGTVNAVGVQFYLDMIHDALAQEQRAGVSPRDVVVQLPLAAIIPTSYIADVSLRTHYYQILSRASSLAELKSHFAALTKQYGSPPLEMENLYLILRLQHVAASASITRLASQAITPVDEDPYMRLSLEAASLPAILPKLSSLGNWVVHQSALTLDVTSITPVLIEQMISYLSPH